MNTTYQRLLAKATPTTLTGIKIVFKDYTECREFDRQWRAAGNAGGTSIIKYYRNRNDRSEHWWAFIPTNLPTIHE